MANLLKNPDHKAQIGYNGFDLSHLLNFSSTTGELLPVFYDLLQPGDKVTCSTELKTRTMELASAAMCRINEHLEWFFVPMTQIYSLFGDFFYQIQDVKSSLVTPANFNSASLPYFPAAAFKLGPLATSDQFGYRSQYRLLDMFVPYTNFINGTTVSSSGIADNFPVSICPIFFAAYQKIWMDFYRLTDRDLNDPVAYNLDAFYSSPTMSVSSNSGLLEMFKMRYRPVRKDYFTNVFVSPLFGRGDTSSSANSYILDSVNQWLVSYQATGLGATFSSNQANGAASNPISNGFPTTISGGPSASQSASTQTLATDVNLIRNALSPTSIRTSFALQKLMEITRRAGKHYDKQTLAHFGVSVPNGISGEVDYLGSSHSVVNIGDVIATSNGTAGGSTSVLGQVGGKGYGFDKSKPIKFEAPCHGILMCIYSADVERCYANSGIDKLMTLVRRSDWPSPEFDNLGMEPLFQYNVDFDPTDTSNFFGVFGWQYRYSAFKVKHNRNVGALDLPYNLNYWVNNTKPNIALGSNHKNNFYVSPAALNGIMLVNFSDLVYSSSSQGVTTFTFYYSDPLIHQLYFDVKKASKMSIYGLESL